MFEALAAILPLCIMIYQEYLSHSANQTKEEKAFGKDQATLKKIVDAAVNKWNDANLQKSNEAKNAWDKADEKEEENKDEST